MSELVSCDLAHRLVTKVAYILPLCMLCLHWVGADQQVHVSVSLDLSAHICCSLNHKGGHIYLYCSVVEARQNMPGDLTKVNTETLCCCRFSPMRPCQRPQKKGHTFQRQGNSYAWCVFCLLSVMHLPHSAAEDT